MLFLLQFKLLHAAPVSLSVSCECMCCRYVLFLTICVRLFETLSAVKNNIYQCRGLNGLLSSRNRISQAIDFTALIQSLFLGFLFSPQFVRHLGIRPFATYFPCSFSNRNLSAPTIYFIPRTISVINLVFSIE